MREREKKECLYNASRVVHSGSAVVVVAVVQ